MATASVLPVYGRVSDLKLKSERRKLAVEGKNQIKTG